MVIRRIAQNVSNRLNLRQLHVDENLVGMDSHLKEMSSRLCMESNDVRMIGIYGLSGIGKTTLAKVVYNQIAHQFEDAIFLPNVAKAEEGHRLLKLQRQLVAHILGVKNVRISNIDEGISLIKKTFCSRKVLIILDDVCNLTQLESLGGNHQWFGSGSRIIITTRDMNLLRIQQVDALYKVEELKYKEAFQLFCSVAFKQNLPEDGFKDLSASAVNYCNGLPLAIQVVGSILGGNSTREWESRMCRMRRVLPTKVQEVLRTSFNELHSIEQNLFLDVACFFNGEDTNFAGRILDDDDMHLSGRILDSDKGFELGMKILRERSLISTLDNKIMMHDLIQQMALEIVRQESPDQPGKRSRLWNPWDVLSVMTKNTVRAKCPNKVNKYPRVLCISHFALKTFFWSHNTHHLYFCTSAIPFALSKCFNGMDMGNYKSKRQ